MTDGNESDALTSGSLLRDAAVNFGAALAAVVVAESIGNVTVPLGSASVVLFPLVWSLLIGAAISLAHRGIPDQLARSIRTQGLASRFIQAAILLFVVKLGFIIGDSLPKIAAAGWGILFQEFGHFFGTMAIALPLAVILGVKREAVGATFSIGREFSVAIVSEKYGMNSAEGRGVLAEYVTGTVIGAIVIAVLAGTLASLHVFDIGALALGAGVGSGSMMSAAVGALTAQAPARATEIAALAAASNLLTTTVGTYFTMFLSLPFASWLYERLEPVLAPRLPEPRASAEPTDGLAQAMDEMADAERGSVGMTLVTVVVSGVIALIGNWIATKVDPVAAAPALLVMLAVVLLGMGLHRAARALHVPLVCWVSLFGILATAPFSPTAAVLHPLVARIGLLPLVTPVLAYAGLSLAKDLPILRRLGWRIVVVSIVANAGTFFFGTLIAEAFQH